MAAARALGVNQSTVHRRIAELERRLGLNLVVKTRGGYRLTELGELLLQAEQVETAIESLRQTAEELKSDLHGTIRLTCPEPTVARIAATGLIDRFLEQYPRLSIEYVTSDRYLDLSRGEADVAFRSGEPIDETLVGRKICDSIWAVYASRSYINSRGRPTSISDLSNHSLIGFDGIMLNHRAARWLATVAPLGSIVSRSNSMLGAISAVGAGLGVAPLPTTLGDADDSLVQVLPPVDELTRSWYLLTRGDLRKTPRIAAFVDYLLANITALRTALVG